MSFSVLSNVQAASHRAVLKKATYRGVYTSSLESFCKEYVEGMKAEGIFGFDQTIEATCIFGPQ
jgi:hypothetical protein